MAKVIILWKRLYSKYQWISPSKQHRRRDREQTRPTFGKLSSATAHLKTFEWKISLSVISPSSDYRHSFSRVVALSSLAVEICSFTRSFRTLNTKCQCARFSNFFLAFGWRLLYFELGSLLRRVPTSVRICGQVCIGLCLPALLLEKSGSLYLQRYVYLIWVRAAEPAL